MKLLSWSVFWILLLLIYESLSSCFYFIMFFFNVSIYFTIREAFDLFSIILLTSFCSWQFFSWMFLVFFYIIWFSVSIDCVSGSIPSWDSFCRSFRMLFYGLRIRVFIELRLVDVTGEKGSKTFDLPNVTVIYTEAHD